MVAATDYCRIKKPGKEVWTALSKEEFEFRIHEGSVGPDWEIWSRASGEVCTVATFLEGGHSEKIVAGFWRRFRADLIDAMVLVGTGCILGLLFFDPLMHLGVGGRLVGFGIAFLYLAVMNSSLCGGQTIGKRSASIRLVDGNGATLSLGKSSLRYCVLAFPFFLNNAPLFHSLILLFLQGTIICGLGVPILYLYIFNKKTRQSLHDLAVGSYIVPAGREDISPKPRIWRGHFAISIALALLVVALPYLAFAKVSPSAMKDLLSSHQMILQQPEVSAASLTDGSQTFFDSRRGAFTVKNINSQVRLRTRVSNVGAEADKIAEIILNGYPPAKRRDYIFINIIYGFDIGIASWSHGQGFNYSPAEWENRIKSFSDTRI
jgi:uncharacterized RDD family membrane protein YckC